MALCAGTTRAGKPCTVSVPDGERYCYNHDPSYAEERKRSATRAARVGNSKVGAELKGVRLMVRDLVETTVSGELHPTVKKRLSEVVGLLQVYSRLAELEIASGDVPRFPGKDYVALPEDTAEKAKGWAEGEAEREKAQEAFMGRLQSIE